MKRIPLTQGKFALVDDEDFERVNQYRWHTHPNCRCWYAERQIRVKNGKQRQSTISMHRFIMRCPEFHIDHKDRNGLNNQKSNLRLATLSQNQWNRIPQKGCTSQYKGVCWDKKREKWKVHVKYESKQIYLGYFKSEKKAAKTYDVKAEELYGEFARLNFN